MGVGGISLWQIIILALFALALMIPAHIARKAGFSGWWAVLLFVPLVNIITIWIFAFVDWPVHKNTDVD